MARSLEKSQNFIFLVSLNGLPSNGWINYLECKGSTYPALLMYQELADMACDRITAAITRVFIGDRPIKAMLDPYNCDGFDNTRQFQYLEDAIAGKRIPVVVISIG